MSIGLVRGTAIATTAGTAVGASIGGGAGLIKPEQSRSPGSVTRPELATLLIAGGVAVGVGGVVAGVAGHPNLNFSPRHGVAGAVFAGASVGAAVLAGSLSG